LTKVDFTTGLVPRSLTIGDLDGDGKVDLVVANAGSNTISVFRNNSTGVSNHQNIGGSQGAIYSAAGGAV